MKLNCWHQNEIFNHQNIEIYIERGCCITNKLLQICFNQNTNLIYIFSFD